MYSIGISLCQFSNTLDGNEVGLKFHTEKDFRIKQDGLNGDQSFPEINLTFALSNLYLTIGLLEIVHMLN